MDFESEVQSKSFTLLSISSVIISLFLICLNHKLQFAIYLIHTPELIGLNKQCIFHQEKIFHDHHKLIFSFVKFVKFVPSISTIHKSEFVEASGSVNSFMMKKQLF